MNPTRSDRTVHARYEGAEIVRYDRSGKWYLEPTHPDVPRKHIGIDEAVESARMGLQWANGEVIPGLPGGSAFDRRMNLS